jgi:hypothetical protein
LHCYTAAPAKKKAKKWGSMSDEEPLNAVARAKAEKQNKLGKVGGCASCPNPVAPGACESAAWFPTLEPMK